MRSIAKAWPARRIHLWTSIILAVPMALMAITGILIAMRGVMHVTVPLSWLGAETKPERMPIGSFAQASDNSSWIGNGQGLYRIAAGKAEPIQHFQGQEVVGMAFRSGAELPVVATRMAIWEETNGAWTPVRRGRVRQLTTLPDGRVFVVIGGRGELADGKPFVSDKAGEWKIFMPAMKANELLPKLEDPRIQLHQLMRELHSGAFFFGKGPGERIWSNILGWVLVLLTLTGLWMWLKAERVKARKRVTKKHIVPTGRSHPLPVPAGE